MPLLNKTWQLQGSSDSFHQVLKGDVESNFPATATWPPSTTTSTTFSFVTIDESRGNDIIHFYKDITPPFAKVLKIPLCENSVNKVFQLFFNEFVEGPF